jgi:hypothetical protein
MNIASAPWICVLAFGIAVTASANGAQTIFPSPEQAANALLVAVESDNYELFLSIAGSHMTAFWSTGDVLRDLIERHRFEDAARRSGITTDSRTPGRSVLRVGHDTFPAPLVQTEGGWRFDDVAGARELTKRRMRSDEVAVVELCRRFREAEYQFLAQQDNGRRAFAQKIGSTPGTHDGLVWTDTGEGDESPLGPAFSAAAFFEPQPSGGPRPLFGYYFKILTAQGSSALGGALDYREYSQLRYGFALIAWPAVYGVAGLRTFLIDGFGDIYQKDLGPDSSRIAEAISVFDPDRTWTPVGAGQQTSGSPISEK